MSSDDLRKWSRDIVSSLLFAWTQLKPEMLHTLHKLALATSEKTKHIDPLFDAPVHDLVFGTKIKPSEMQAHLLSKVVPSFLPSIQSIAEDELRSHYGNTASAYDLIESMADSNVIDRKLASRAHHWRIARNIVAHGGGVISKRTEQEVIDLKAKGKVDFSQFLLWGPLLDAGHGGTLVPLTEKAIADPENPIPILNVSITEGSKLPIGMVDLIAATDVWSAVIGKLCDK